MFFYVGSQIMLAYRTTANGNRKIQQSEQRPDICPLCGESLHPEIADLHVLCETWTIEQIKKDHPEWVEADGLCPKCLEYYLNL